MIRFLHPDPLSIEVCNSLHRFSIFFTALDLHSLHGNASIFSLVEDQGSIFIDFVR